ncbi:MAG TPA: hypothetical protein VHO23_02810 [Candidatus Paceibacterota bacterium]|nr:hypothetical protein [Candidatus Paceibacterota bacterium]
MQDKGHSRDSSKAKPSPQSSQLDTFVLDKGIFSNVFDKDIRRVYIYKKAERLAKAIHLIAPGFRNSAALREKLDLIAVGLVDGATLPPVAARQALSRELLSLSSILSIARSGGILSPMNADFIAREAHHLLEEVALYEEPRLALDESPTLAALARASQDSARPQAAGNRPATTTAVAHGALGGSPSDNGQNIGHAMSDTSGRNARRDAIISVLKEKGPSYIKDISTVIRDVSEKTIQRELAALVSAGTVTREGERRWTTYALAG